MVSKKTVCRKKSGTGRNKKPKIFILSGPGGAGKTTLISRLFRKKSVRDNFLRLISFTTRGMRAGEQEARDYFFVEEDEFLRLKEKGFFLETQKVLDDFYGTPRLFLKEAQRVGKDLILCIDVKGGEYLKKKCKKDKVVTVFITAQGEKELFLRLKKRKENKEHVMKRINLEKKELQYSKYYDYLVVNKKIEESLGRLEEILKKER